MREHIESLIKKAVDAETPTEAINYSLAALNCANALSVLGNLSDKK